MWIVIFAGILLALPFLFFPELDLYVSSLVYSAEEGFIYKENLFVIFLYDLVPNITIALTIAYAAAALIRFLRPRFHLFRGDNPIPTYRQLAFLFLAMVLGPGLIVHQGFKDHWERARPINIQEFGGEKTYTPPFVISDQGGKSFVSGHAAMGYYFAAIALLFSGRRRTQIYIGGITLGLLFGFGRILQGGHFLSDILFAGVVALLVNHILHRIICQKTRAKTAN